VKPASCPYWKTAQRRARAAEEHGWTAEELARALCDAYETGRLERERRAVPVTMQEAQTDYRETHWGDKGKGRAPLLRVADPREGTAPVLGTLIEVVYETTKAGERAEWEHAFDAPRPKLLYSVRSRLLMIAGGAYTVNERGIVG